ncbi:MAG: LPXTG cell wall anchor domain-containing protein [Actinomycetota bacterium]
MSTPARRLVGPLVAIAALGAALYAPAAHAVVPLPPTPAPDTTLTLTETARTNHATGTFTFSSDAGATFECRVDLGLWEVCSGTPALVGSDEVASHTTGTLIEGFHTFEVRATVSLVTDPTPATFVWYVDLTAPAATITSKPANPSNESAPSFTFSSEAGATYKCDVDSAPPVVCSSPFTTAQLPDGPHTFNVTATDTVGNTQASPTTYTWTVDLDPPDTTITRLGSTPSAEVVTFILTSDEPVTFECNLDGSGFTPCNTGYTTPLLSDGEHTLLVRAIDAAGNIDPTFAVHQWLIDTTPPDTIMTVTPEAISRDATAGFEFIATESPATFECDIDNLGYAPCSSPFVSGTLADGSHTFSVRATDSASRIDSSPATHTWTVANRLPETGSNTNELLALAGALLTAGTVFMLARRRPRTAEATGTDGRLRTGCVSRSQSL